MTLQNKIKSKRTLSNNKGREDKKSSEVPPLLSGIQEISNGITGLIQKGTLFEHWLDDLYSW